MFTIPASHAGRAYHAAAAQPNWVTRWAIYAILLVLLVPIVLLVMFALAVGLVVFFALSTVHTIKGWVTGGPSRGDGRQNVRVLNGPRD